MYMWKQQRKIVLGKVFLNTSQFLLPTNISKSIIMPGGNSSTLTSCPLPGSAVFTARTTGVSAKSLNHTWRAFYEQNL